jgi:hypothetical protein
MPFGTLVQRVARDLYVDEVRHSGWAVEIGVFGPVLFLPDAAREIEAADGALWQIDRSAGPRPAETPPTHT